MTPTGVEALRAALPACKVEFVGGAVASSGDSAAKKPGGTDDKAIAAWVRALRRQGRIPRRKPEGDILSLPRE